MAGVKSVERAIALLSQVALQPAGLVALSDATGLPTSTTARLLATLENLDALRRDEDGIYCIGPTVAVLAVNDSGPPSQRALAMPYLEELATTLDEAVGLSVVTGDETVTIAQVDIPRPVQAQNWEGTRWPLHQGASGHALVATWDPDDITAFVAAHPEVPDLQKHLADAPESGVWWSVGSYVEGLTSAAVPVLDRDGRGVASLYVYGPSYRFPEPGMTEHIETSLVDRATRIARAWSSRQTADADPEPPLDPEAQMTTDSPPTTEGGRAPRGRRRQRVEGPGGPAQAPWRQLHRVMDPVRAVSEDQLEAIVDAAHRVLSRTGIDFLHPQARELWAAAGAELDGDRVHLDPALVDDLVARAPGEFTLRARNPAHDVHIGGDSVAFAAVASAPYVSDLASGRREGNRADFENLLRLTQSLNAIHLHGGYPVEPTDVHASVRHLLATRSLLTLTDKVPHAYSLGAQRNIDCLEMVRIARQVDDATLDEQPSIFTVINASSPLRFDEPMLEGVLQYSSRNQPVVITPFTLAGAMAPVTLAGALVQQHAEALAGIAFSQLVRPGAPVVYGGFTSNVDMRSGSPAFGTPEYVKAALVGGQLARSIGVPYRSSNVCAANAVDSQSGYESAFSLWGAVMGGANLVMHGAGWLEGGLRASYEKMVVDADTLAMMAAFLDPIIVDDATLAVDAIAEVGPGGHYFGIQHTQDRFRDAFFAPMVSDWRNFESWEEAGSPTAGEHAARLVRELLDAYQPPVLAPEAAEQLDEYVARRVAEGGVQTDF